MTSSRQSDSPVKAIARKSWRLAQFAHVSLTAPLSCSNELPRIFYGGARSGNLGGPLVKIKRLQQYFPASQWFYNTVYLVSNAPYLPKLALEWIKLNRVPMILNQNGVFYSGWYSGDWRSQNRIMADAYHLADYVFWQSDFCRRTAEKFLGNRSGSGEVLFNAIDIDRFTPALEPSSRPITFLVTGKIDSHMTYRLISTIKGFGLACQLGLDARLNIAGWIEDLTAVRSAIKTYSDVDKVNILGPYTQEAAPMIYRDADVYVMTKYQDPCPNTVIEAMSCGLPVLYSASGGVPELVGDDAGIAMTVPEDWEKIHTPSPEVIAEGMQEIAALKSSMSQAARSRAESCFNLVNWIDRHRTVFSKLLRSIR
ncbi:MAG: glycosyltransferase family 4 protein [Burkholderiales bacterium]|nr:glycosyltransferase family 4 protein [Burkholderiales bacterium]